MKMTERSGSGILSRMKNESINSNIRFPLFRRIPQFAELTQELVLDRFLEYVAEKGLQLYPSQEEAILELMDGNNVILNTPTGSGKSLVATAMHFHSLSLGRKSVYTCPIKALVNEKFLTLCREFGPEQVGMVTGDGQVNADAPIICCTAEILAQRALREGKNIDVDDVIMDEFHYYSDRDRGVNWQIPLLIMENSRFLLMSATLGEMDFFVQRLESLTSKKTAVVSRVDRPVPLDYEYRETPLHETILDLIKDRSAPIYLVNFTQKDAADAAQALMSVDFCSKEEKKQIAESLYGIDFSSPYGKEIQKYLKHGVGIHHAGLLPRYRLLVESLAQKGLLKVISGTDTLGVGVNVPIRSVLFTKLCKYDGQKTAILTVRDFHQIAGRAGRKGFDDRGLAVAQAPAHVIENLKMEAKAKADPKKMKKMVKVKPPERGFVPWSQDTFDKLVHGRPESLQSRFQITHGILLNVLSRKNEDGCLAMKTLLKRSHESDLAKKKHRRHGFVLFRSLVDRQIIELNSERESSEPKIRVHVDLQEDFSIHHALGLYLIDTIPLLEGFESRTESPQAMDYALEVLTLVESILENPDVILRRQLDRLKGEKIRELKEAGVEYEERMEQLEALEHPKPMRDFIYSTFNSFADRHPWVGTDNIRPKSVAREMFEKFMSFSEYIREYDLQRAEGVLLRYLSEVYRTLVQAVPEGAKTDGLYEVIHFFNSIVRNVDASLLTEWEKIRTGDIGDEKDRLLAIAGASKRGMEQAPTCFVDNQKTFLIALRNEVFRFVRAMAIGDVEDIKDLLAGWQSTTVTGSELSAEKTQEGARLEDGVSLSIEKLEDRYREYLSVGHARICTDTSARNQKYSEIVIGEMKWVVRQTIVDPDENNDWHLVFELDVEESNRCHKFILRLMDMCEIGV